jgi:Domain of Unknown Function (DUF928)
MNEQITNKPIFHLLSICLSLVINLSIAFPHAIVRLDTVTAQQLKKKKQVPPPPSPPSKGFPGNRTVSASMSSNNCDLKLIALAPEFDRHNSERSVWGQTTAERPTFWFFVPTTPASTSLEFSLQNRQGEDIYRAPIPTPQQPGVIGVRIPNKIGLQRDLDYHWTLKAKVPCGIAASNRVYVDGWVKRVSLPSMDDKSDNFAAQGIWYDAVTNLARQRLQKPNDAQLQQDWSELLASGNLLTIAKQPILNR